MPRVQDFILLMTSDEVSRLEVFVRERARTVDGVHDYLVAEFGFVDSESNPGHERAVSRSAVGRWKRSFESGDKLKAASVLAAGVVETARQNGSVAIGEAATHTL